MRRNDSKLILNMDDPAYEKILFFGILSEIKSERQKSLKMYLYAILNFW